MEGSSGSPLIRRYNNNLILGIHTSGVDINNNSNNQWVNFATPFDIIIKDIKEQLSNKKNEYKNRINLIYDKKEEGKDDNNIFGKKFVEKNKDKINLIIK